MAPESRIVDMKLLERVATLRLGVAALMVLTVDVAVPVGAAVVDGVAAIAASDFIASMLSF